MKFLPRCLTAVVFALSVALATHSVSQADEPGYWKLVAGDSKIEFAGKQMGVPTGGSFGAFSADIVFDKSAPADGRVRVVIDLESVNASYPVLAQVLRTEPWFNVAAHPEAIFESNTITATDSGAFAAEGTLSLRGIRQPVRFDFSFEHYGPDPDAGSSTLAIMTGGMTVLRTAFGVGQGEWGDVSIVDDAVEITVRFVARQSGP